MDTGIKSVVLWQGREEMAGLVSAVLEIDSEGVVQSQGDPSTDQEKTSNRRDRT